MENPYTLLHFISLLLLQIQKISLKKTTLKLLINIHTYIIDNYNPSVRITVLLFILLMLCVLILCVSGGTYSLKSTPNDRFFEKLF